MMEESNLLYRVKLYFRIIDQDTLINSQVAAWKTGKTTIATTTKAVCPSLRFFPKIGDNTQAVRVCSHPQVSDAGKIFSHFF